jgi:TQXA domain-containing protein/LPXTG-motif cell wall-anchored protein
MASRLRIGTALLGAVAALSFSALSASAAVIIEPYPHDSPEYKNREKGHNVWLTKESNVTNPKSLEHQTSLIPLKIKDAGETTNVVAFCVDLPTPLADDDGLKEEPWGTRPNPNSQFPENAPHILWILHNTYPTLDMNAFQAKWGKQYDREEAIAATQAAIWHFSEKVSDLDKSHPQNDDDVVALYDEIVKQGKANKIEKQPDPTLVIEPESLSGEAGKKIGPFKVTTTAEKIELTAKLPKGVTLTNAQGEPLAAEQKDDKVLAKAGGQLGSEFYVNVAAGTPKGDVSIDVKAEAVIATGRLFVSRDSNNAAQALVIAQDHKAKVEKTVKADWKEGVKPSEPPTTTTTTTTTTTAPTTTTTTNNPAPGGGEDLASTGASILWPLVGGLVLVGGGIAALFVVRRKKAGA